MPSLALRMATSRPRIWVVKRSLMARPAASSFALLMRRPDERRWMVVASELPLVLRLRWALSDIVLVLITCAMGSSPLIWNPLVNETKRRLFFCVAVCFAVAK